MCSGRFLCVDPAVLADAENFWHFCQEFPMDGIQQSIELVLQDIQPALVQQKVQNAFFGPPGFCLALFDNQFGKGIPDTGVGTECLFLRLQLARQIGWLVYWENDFVRRYLSSPVVLAADFR